MKQSTHRRLIRAAKITIIAGLGLGIISNIASLFLNSSLWWAGLILSGLGLAAWPVTLFAPKILAVLSKKQGANTYRLLYHTPGEWDSTRARRAFLNLIRTGVKLEIIWSRDGHEPGCWLSIDSYQTVLEQLVKDLFPESSLEADVCPEPAEGAAILHWPGDGLPSPAELCEMAGIEGVYYRWVSETAAVTVLWGPQAGEIAGKLAGPAGFLAGQGTRLLATPEYLGDNPWPSLPEFPSSEKYAGLSSVSHIVQVAPELRVDGAPALVLGRDAEARSVGFRLPDLGGMGLLYVFGESSDLIITHLAGQAVQAGGAVFVLDGQGLVTTRLSRRLLREVATDRVLVCDVERPAQSRLRLNPLWLPDEAEARDKALESWPQWLRELGVTAAGLGQQAYRYTQVAVILTALVTYQKKIRLDVSGLREALLAPDFLAMIEEKHFSGQRLPFSQELWQWWLSEGRLTGNFDAHLRLAHLRDRLGMLLDLPEYSVLWQTPYVDPAEVLRRRQSLFWRLPDRRNRLSAYVSSQLLALSTLFTAWPNNQRQPVLVFLHELRNVQPWVERLRSFPQVRLVVSSEAAALWPQNLAPDSLLVSRLNHKGAALIQPKLPKELGVRPADLRRLPPTRLIFQRGQCLATVEIEEQYLI